jgi:indolepyruvate ferredoxin oxidoreductase alpha subunit
MGTTWPLPPGLMQKYLSLTDNILIVEEVISFLEENVKILCAELTPQIGTKIFFGKKDGVIPTVGEMNADLVIAALCKILNIEKESVPETYIRRADELAACGAPGRE